MNEQVDSAIGGYEADTIMGGALKGDAVGVCRPPSTTISKRLRTMADIINMGEGIRWGSDTALMDEAADYIDQLQSEMDEQCRINGLGGERELALMAKVEKQRAVLVQARAEIDEAIWRNDDPEQGYVLHAINAHRMGEVLTAIDNALEV